ncbi:MAG: hypothetical protein ACREP7_00565 [Lysobacter sp.]
MFASKGFAFSLMATTLAICIAASIFVLHASSHMLQGQTWTIGLLGGQNLRLLDSGRYTHQAWCDICPEEKISRGSWRRSGDLIVLTSDKPGRPEHRLRAATIKNCAMLIPLDDKMPVKWISHSTVFTHRDDPCAIGLDLDGHTDRLLRDLN